MSQKLLNNRWLILLVGLILIGCKKEKPEVLEGEKSIFVGTWNWSYTTHRHNFCEGGAVVTDTLTPETENHAFKIQFLEEGKIIFFQDGINIAEHSIFFNEYKESIACSILIDSKKFNIAFAPEESSKFSGCINSNMIKSVFFEEFLFPFTPGCEEYSNFFIKE